MRTTEEKSVSIAGTGISVRSDSGPKTIAAERGLAYKGNIFLAGGQKFRSKETGILHKPGGCGKRIARNEKCRIKIKKSNASTGSR